MTWVLYFLFAFGLAYIVGHSVISLPFRRWLGGSPIKLDAAGELLHPATLGALGAFGDFICALIECPACFGFWVGAVASFVITSPLPMPQLIWCWVFGCATSGANFGLSRLTRLI